MAEEKKVLLREGAPIPAIQSVGDSLQKMGAPIPGIQAVPSQSILPPQELIPPAQPAQEQKPNAPAQKSGATSGS